MESLELVWLFGNASCATPILGKPRRTFSHKKKTCLSISPPPRVNLQHPCLRSPAICTRVPASFASPVFAHNSSYAPPSQHNPLHSTLGQQTTQALPDDDAVTDTTTDALLRNGRDLTVRAERSTLGLRPSHLGTAITSCSRQQGGDLAVPKKTRNRQRGLTLELRRLVTRAS